MGDLKLKKREDPVLYQKKEECCGCAACYSVCPKNAITMKADILEQIKIYALSVISVYRYVYSKKIRIHELQKVKCDDEQEDYQ